MKWMVAPSYQNGTIAAVDEENRKARVIMHCPRCYGTGYYGPVGVEGGICFECRGAKKIAKWVKAYTEEEYEQYMNQQEKTRERKERKRQEQRDEAMRESEANKLAFLEANGYDTARPQVWLVVGRDTFSIKDELKANGFKFNPALNWYATREKEIPEGYTLTPVDFDEVFNWNCFVRNALIKENAKDIAEAARKLTMPKSDSEWLGEVKERIRDLKVELTGCRTLEGFYGTTYIYTFKNGANVLTWFSSCWKDVEIGDILLLTGTVKAHTEFAGEKQTQLTRCILKKEQ